MDDDVDRSLEMLFESDAEELDENSGNKENGNIQKEKDKGNPDLTKLLVVTRLGMEKEFIEGKKNKNTLWRKCVDEMKKSYPNLTTSILDAPKKFSNLLVTYNRIKKRKNKSGRGSVFWLYFEEFDSVYGVRHNIIPPKKIIFDSFRNNNESQKKDENAENRNSPDKSCEIEIEISKERSKRKKMDDNVGDLLAYLKQEDEKERIRHNDIMRVEKVKIIWKERRSIVSRR